MMSGGDKASASSSSNVRPTSSKPSGTKEKGKEKIAAVADSSAATGTGSVSSEAKITTPNASSSSPQSPSMQDNSSQVYSPPVYQPWTPPGHQSASLFRQSEGVHLENTTINAPSANHLVQHFVTHHTIPFNSQNPEPNGSEDDISKSDSEIYFDALFLKGRGCPLWHPGPAMNLPIEYRKEGISSGDVGIIYRSGGFSFLFNIFLPADHAFNRGRVPDSFVPFSANFPENACDRFLIYNPGSHIASSSVDNKSTADAVDMVFESCASEGALLVMPEGAMSVDLRIQRSLRQYMAKHIESWYRYVVDDCGRDVNNGDIRLVTGFDKVPAWGIATFQCHERSTLVLQSSRGERGSSERRWIGGNGRFGPAVIEIETLKDPDQEGQTLWNQRTFIRSLNAKLPRKAWSKLGVDCPARDTVGEEDGDCSRISPRPTPPERHQANKTTTRRTRGRQLGEPQDDRVNVDSSDTDLPLGNHPSTKLNDFLMEQFVSDESTIVITHDNAWMAMVSEVGGEPKSPVFSVVQEQDLLHLAHIESVENINSETGVLASLIIERRFSSGHEVSVDILVKPLRPSTTAPQGPLKVAATEQSITNSNEAASSWPAQYGQVQDSRLGRSLFAPHIIDTHSGVSNTRVDSKQLDNDVLRPRRQYDEDSDRGHNKRPFRKERDDKVHDSAIEERIQHERLSRTLFIRNIKYETPSEVVRRLFEEQGDIKTFLDLISTRGMVFVTYYDLRAAERARDRFQGTEINGRPIDIHYSLPRDGQKGEPDSDKNQGTLQVTLRGSKSGIIDDNELRRMFRVFGDIKSIQPVNERYDSRYVEFYDMRARKEVHDRLGQQPLHDGLMDIVLAWDVNEAPPHQRDGHIYSEERDYPDGGRGSGRGRGSNEYDDEGRKGGGDYGRPGREHRSGRGPRHDSGPRYGGGYSDRYEGDPGSHGSGGYGMQGHGPSGPPPPSPYSLPPPPVRTSNYGVLGERLGQARNIQQLLAVLKQPGAAAGPPAPPVLSNPYYPSSPLYADVPSSPYASPLPPPAHRVSPLAPPPSNPALAGRPPNILALLTSAATRTSQPPAVGQPSYGGLPPVSALNGAAPVPNAQYQQLMSYLRSQDAEPPAAGKP